MQPHISDTLQTQALETLSRAFNEIPFNRMLGLHLENLTKDFITIKFEMKQEFIGNYLHQILHGGVISSVLDMAGGMAAMVSVIYKTMDKTPAELAKIIGKSSTIDLHVCYVQPGKGKNFVAEARATHAGNKICFTNMELRNHESTLIATATGTYLVG